MALRGDPDRGIVDEAETLQRDMLRCPAVQWKFQECDGGGGGLPDCCHSQICYIIKKQMEMGSAPN